MNIVCSLSRWERPEEHQTREQRLVRSTLGKEDDMCLQKAVAETHDTVPAADSPTQMSSSFAGSSFVFSKVA